MLYCRLVFLLSALSIFCTPVYGQIILKGKLLAKGTNQPLPYANIGILNTPVGTISNPDGSFMLSVPEEYSSAEVLFSTLGYERKQVSVATLQKQPLASLYLAEEAQQLEIVTISSKRKKRRALTLGNGRSLLLSGQLYSDTLSAGSAMALLIENPKSDEIQYLDEVSLYIARNLFPEFKIRIRIQAVDSANNNKPGKDILLQNVIGTSSIKKGWLKFKLPASAAYLALPKFYLVFEWILDAQDRRYISQAYASYIATYPDRVSYDTTIVKGEKVIIPKVSQVVAGTIFGVTHTKAALQKYTCYYRNNSFGDWKPASAILSAQVKMANYPQPSGHLPTNPCPGAPLTCLLNNWSKGFLEDNSLPGLQIAISKNNELAYSGYFGFADLVQRKRVKPDTRFRIASISKPLTAAGLLKLAERNQINLDTAIQAYVKGYPNQTIITARQLAGHLGGLRDYHEQSLSEVFIQEHYPNLRAATTLFANDSLVAPPGAAFNYSPYGYILLGAAIEGASQKAYLEYMRQAIWQPLGMYNTYGDVADSLMPNKARFYFLNGTEATPYNLSYAYPSGGLLSTSEDLLKFGNSLLSDNFMTADLRRQMFTSQYTANGIATGYGLGWFIYTNAQGQRVWYHTGELPSSFSTLILYPDQNIVISILANGPVISESDGINEEVQELCTQVLTILN